MSRRGFTLLELMVVLALLALTAVAAVPAFLSRTATSPEQRLASAVADALMRTRALSREGGSPAVLVLSPQDGRFWIDMRDSSETGILPVANGVRLDGDSRIACRFEARGSASACVVRVRGARELAVRVDAWNGEIRLGDGHAQ